MSLTSSYSGTDGTDMKFDLTAQQPVPRTSGTADGSFDVMPEAVHSILSRVQAEAAEFEQLLQAAAGSIGSLANECKAPPISRELSTFSTFILAKTSRSAAGRTDVSVGAVNEAVLALVRADEQLSETARQSAAVAAQDGVTAAPGVEGSSRRTGRGPAQAF